MSEKLILSIIGILTAMALIFAVDCENAEITAFADEIEEDVEEDVKVSEKGQIPLQTMCLAELYAERRKNESQTVEEVEEDERQGKETPAQTAPALGMEEDSTMEAEADMGESDDDAHAEDGTVGTDRLDDAHESVTIDGDVLDAEVARYLRTSLENKGIGWWWPYALCRAHQESSFQTDQVTNGIDFGLFQYRIYYWTEWEDRAGVAHGDILDPFHQIDVYTEMVRQWIAEGRSIEETIGAHNYGGWSWEYDPQYVRDVMRWMR